MRDERRSKLLETGYNNMEAARSVKEMRQRSRGKYGESAKVARKTRYSGNERRLNAGNTG